MNSTKYYGGLAIVDLHLREQYQWWLSILYRCHQVMSRDCGVQVQNCYLISAIAERGNFIEAQLSLVRRFNTYIAYLTLT